MDHKQSFNDTLKIPSATVIYFCEQWCHAKTGSSFKKYLTFNRAFFTAYFCHVYYIPLFCLLLSLPTTFFKLSEKVHLCATFVIYPSRKSILDNKPARVTHHFSGNWFHSKHLTKIQLKKAYGSSVATTEAI